MNAPKIENQLREIVNYFGLTRGVGHTTVMVEGTRVNPRTLVLASNHRLGMEVTNGGREGHPLTLDDLVVPKFKGWRRPLVVDNGALRVLCAEAHNTILEQRKELEYLRDFSRTVDGEAKMYRRLYNEASALKREWMQKAREWGVS